MCCLLSLAKGVSLVYSENGISLSNKSLYLYLSPSFYFLFRNFPSLSPMALHSCFYPQLFLSLPLSQYSVNGTRLSLDDPILSSCFRSKKIQTAALSPKADEGFIQPLLTLDGAFVASNLGSETCFDGSLQSGSGGPDRRKTIRSIMCVPLMNVEGLVLAVVKLVNRYPPGVIPPRQAAPLRRGPSSVFDPVSVAGVAGHNKQCGWRVMTTLYCL